MTRPEAELVRKWRKRFGLTMEKLGELCPRPVGRNRIYDIEKGKSSASVDTLLNIIGGLERAPTGLSFGSGDGPRLSHFFLGPEGVDQDHKAEAAAVAFVRSRRQGRRLQR